jgi:hypothetical protein
MFRGGLDDQVLCDAVDLSPAPEEVDIGDAEPAQGSLDPARFIEGLSVGDLLGCLRHRWLATMLGAERGEHGWVWRMSGGRCGGCGGSRLGARLSGVLVQGEQGPDPVRTRGS